MELQLSPAHRRQPSNPFFIPVKTPRSSQLSQEVSSFLTFPTATKFYFASKFSGTSGSSVTAVSNVPLLFYFNCLHLSTGIHTTIMRLTRATPQKVSYKRSVRAIDADCTSRAHRTRRRSESYLNFQSKFLKHMNFWYKCYKKTKS